MIEDENTWIVEEIRQYQTITHGANFLCMYSGGKDSGLAMAVALEHGGKISGLIHLLENGDSLYHRQSISVIKAQAQAIGTQLYYMPYKWWNNWDRAEADLRQLQKIGAQNIVFGDIRLKYIFLGDIPLCERSGYGACFPIGGVPYDELMKLIEKHRIKSIITTINHPIISRDLLGTYFSREVYEYLKDLDVDPFGELDEFHTTLVDADFFVAPLQYSLVQKSPDNISVIINSCITMKI